MHIPSSRTSDTPSATALRHRITMPMAGPGGARLPPTVGRTHKRPVYEPSQMEASKADETMSSPSLPPRVEARTPAQARRKWLLIGGIVLAVIVVVVVVAVVVTLMV
ncbi:hypothetical protein HBH56_214550 [Parastagonospora nodorum]|nr:hypothetical protein HBH56_214550 [Parastagonospora nodorum]KAH3923035.1 hypothetical protein HBH54_216220 [Parastagonospora nodorum]KAH4081912.1 hypothetical protein HBH48_194940 [Parastagonospora nodorum]KAH4092675.1 hypothetical protein HBH46_182600 [Parastagonospora nodorum]KAH4128506.1 hypothetical protein HBH45_211650 [Parastagonospora nodorum]